MTWLVLEWNNQRPQVIASGFLVDKEKGFVVTAHHFTETFDALGFDTCKAFLDGKVYEAYVDQTPGLRDAALLRLSDFDSDDLPKPYPVSGKDVAKGDKLYIRGFHSHPKWLIAMNEADGFPDTIVPIFKDYYDSFGKAADLVGAEIVYDNLEALVLETRSHIKLPAGSLTFQQMAEEANDYIKTETVRDHRYRFSGLSGGVVVNENEEIVGVITAEQTNFDFKFEPGGIYVKEEYRHVFVTPIRNIEALFRYVKAAR